MDLFNQLNETIKPMVRKMANDMILNKAVWHIHTRLGTYIVTHVTEKRGCSAHWTIRFGSENKVEHTTEAEYTVDQDGAEAYLNNYLKLQ